MVVDGPVPLLLFGMCVIVRSMPNNNDPTDQSREPARFVDLTPAVLLLREAFGPHANIEWRQGADGRDPMEIEVQRVGRTREAQRLRLAPYGTALPSNASSRADSTLPVVWILRRAPTRTRKMLRTQGASYVDLAGAVHLALPWAIVDREGLTPPKQQSPLLQSTADPFADKGSLILRVLLADRDRRGWGVRELAGTAGIGVATASDVVRSLAERGLITATRHGRSATIRLTDAQAAIHAWTRSYDWRVNRGIAVQVPMGDPSRFLHRLPQILQPALPNRARWALTLQAGASLVAPHASWDRVHVYIDVPPTRSLHSLPSIAARAGWQPASDGRLVLMAPHYATSAWYGMRMINDLPVVSDLQLVLDLWHYPVRGREQAELLFERAFGIKKSVDSRHG